MNASELYEAVKEAESVWGRVVVHHSNKRGVDDQPPYECFTLPHHPNGPILPVETAAALIRDAMATWGHERGMHIGKTHQDHFFVGHVAYVADERGEIFADYTAALVAMVKEVG